jgi:CheY-like chemotaxis protein
MEDGSSVLSRRVLVVDDCPDTTATLQLLLRFWGHEARVAHDGPAALALAAAFRPDVVLLDLGLPGMDGYEVARRLRERTDSGRLLVVVLSGYGRDEDRRRSLEAGCDLHWVKPPDSELLRRLLASCPAASADLEVSGRGLPSAGQVGHDEHATP